MMLIPHNLGNVCEAMLDPLLIVDRATLRILYANQATINLTGFDAECLAKSYLPDLFVNLNKKEVSAYHNASGYIFEGLLRTADHGEILSETRVSSLQLDGKVGLVCLIRDIRHRPEREEELRRIETIHRSLIGAMPDLVFRIKRDGTYLDFKLPDDPGLKIPTDDSEIVGKKIADLMPKAVTNDAMQAIEQAFNVGGVHAIEYQIREPGGLHHYEARFVASVEDEVIALVRNITERKRGEDLLRIQRDLSAALSVETNLNRALQRVLDTAIRVAEMDCGGVYLLDRVSSGLELAFYLGVSEAFAQQTAYYEADSPNIKMVRQGKAVWTRFEDTDLTKNEILRREKLLALAMIPIVHQGEIIGCINVASHSISRVSFSARDALETIASQIGSAITRIRAEEARRTSDETMRLLLNASQDIALLFDTNWIILAANEVAAERLESTVEKMIGTYGLNYLRFPDVAAKRKAEGERVIQTGEPVQFEDYSGGRYFSNRIYPLFDARHNVSRLAMFARDITDQRQAEKSLLHRDRLLKAIAQATSRLIGPGEPKKIFNEALKLLAEAIGVERVFIYEIHTHSETGEPVVSYRYGWTDSAAPVQVDYSDLQNIPWRFYGMQGWYDALAQGQAIKLSQSELVDFEPYMVPNHKLTSLALVPIFVNNKFWGIIGFDELSRDHEWTDEEISALRTMSTSIGTVIERQQAEEKLRQEREIADTLREVGMMLTSSLKLEDVLGQIVDQARRLVPCDAANVFLLEENVARLVYFDGYDVFGLTEQQLRQFKFPVEQMPIMREVTQTNEPYLCSDTTRDSKWIFWSGWEWVKSWLGAPIVVRGKVVGIFSFDNTTINFYTEEHARLLKPIAQQAAIAVENAFLFEDTQRLEHIKSEMIRMASHDLRSPLTRIKEATQRIKNEAVEAADSDHRDLTRYCTVLDNAAHEMGQIIGNILSLERIEALHRATKSVVWCDLLAESINTVRDELEEKHHRLSIHCEPDLPISRGDPVQLQRAMSNLIGNAIKYTSPKGHIYIKLYLSSYGDKRTVAFEVQDNGIGIPLELQARIFQPFYRAEQADAADIPGLGLGLSIVRAAIKNHEGNVYFDSEPGKGSLFGFWVPA